MPKQTIAITATFTAEPVKESLDFWMEEFGIPSEIEFAPYNQVFQQLLDPSSLLSRNQNGINVILVRFEDWQRFEEGHERRSNSQPISCEEIEQIVRDFLIALESAADRSAVPYLICLCPASSAVVADPSRVSFLKQTEELIASEVVSMKSVHLIKTSDVASIYPVSAYYDHHGDKLGHIPFTLLFFTSIGSMIARRIYGMQSTPYKVIVLDCDQTLWKGVCGEDGPRGIEIDPSHTALQELIVSRHGAGMLICLCSKNNEEDVLGVFAQRSEMTLKRDHLVSWRVNWRSKAENIKSLAEELHLGLDSFIFIDDDPIACAEVQASCPEVLTIHLPEEASDIPRFINHVWPLDRFNVTEEDVRRTALYKRNFERERFRKEYLNFADFLGNLDLEIQISEMANHQIARVSQLTQRTNQFNLTTIRRSESEIQKLQASNSECLVVEVSDRFGDYGLVGVILFQVSAEAINVDTFLLSCRALGRGVEYRMLARLGEIAQARKLGAIVVRFENSGKNRPALDFLDTIGSKFNQATDSGYLYNFPVDYVASLSFNSHVTGAPDPGLASNVRPISGSSPSSAKAVAVGKSTLINKIATELRDPEQILNIITARKRRARPAKDDNYIAPRTPTEESLARIWSEVLGLERVGAFDNFFELGGHSVLIVQAISRIRDAFDIELPLSSFFEGPRVADMALAITQSRASQRDDDQISQLLEKVDKMSESEMEALIQQRSILQSSGAISDIHTWGAPNAQSAPARDAIQTERYVSYNLNSFPVGEDWKLVYSKSSRSARILRPDTAEFLLRWTRFKTLDDHVRDCSRLQINPAKIESIKNQIPDFVDAKFLVSQKNILNKLRSQSDAQNSPEEIASIGVFTRDRLRVLERSLTSYVQNTKQYGRANDFVVMDDSTSAQTRSECRQMVRALGNQHDVRIYYAGLEEKKGFADRLIQGERLPPEVVNFALFGMENRYKIGANRNAFLLHTIGDITYSVDDDTKCYVGIPPELNGGLAFTSGIDPAQMHFFPDRETALRSLNFVERDILASHEQFLGKDLGSIVSAYDKEAEFDFDQVSPQFVERLESGKGKLLVTFNGLIGDCGWGSPFGYWHAPLGYLFLNGPSHERLVKSETDYRNALTSREISRIVSSPTISDEAFSMSGFMGLDNRTLLPPFMPVKRGSDNIFGTVLWRCFNNACFAHLPWALLHTPAENRRFWTNELFRTASGFDTSRLIIECIKSLDFSSGHKDEKERLHVLGKHLMELGSIPLHDFEEFVRLQVMRSSSSFIRLMEDHLFAHEQSPGFWANDCKKYLDILRHSLLREDYCLPLDLVDLNNGNEPRVMAQELVLKFGQLLYWWPEIVESARDLRVQGHRLARQT